MRSLLAVIIIFISSIIMAGSNMELKVGDVGRYAEMVKRSNPNGFSICHVPSLGSILFAAERKKGSPLTKSEVLSIRDHGSVLVVPDGGKLLEEDRGYKDINPIHAWEEWHNLSE